MQQVSSKTFLVTDKQTDRQTEREREREREREMTYRRTSNFERVPNMSHPV